MKKIGLIAFITTLVIGSILAANSGFGGFRLININFGKVKGSGTAKSESRNVSGFKAIKVRGALSVEVVAQQDFSVTVEADDNLLEHVKTEINNDTLEIWSEGKFSSKRGIKVKISMTEINAVDVSGASGVVVTNVKSDSFRVEVSGASKVKIDGEATTLKSEASGASKIDAENLKVENAEVEVNGASKATVQATNEIKADASGASTVYYTGDPKHIEQRTSGAGSVKRK
jgi:hypothetical protein